MRFLESIPKKNILGGLFFVLLGAATLALTTQIQVRPNLTEPGGRFFPYISGIGMILSGIGIVFYREPAGGRRRKEDGEGEKPFLDKEGAQKMLIFFTSLLLYLLGLTYLGFLIATPFASFAFITILKSERKASIPVSIALSLIVTGILYFTFNYGFNIYLPKGTLF